MIAVTPLEGILLQDDLFLVPIGMIEAARVQLHFAILLPPPARHGIEFAAMQDEAD
jgi:hypothetical protein